MCGIGATKSLIYFIGSEQRGIRLSIGELFRSRARPVGVGILTFGVLALVSLSVMTDSGKHPLALATDVSLCDLLGDEVWNQLEYPAGNPVARAPAMIDRGLVACALELDPVPPNDRWARLARGDDADKVRRIATVTLMTTAALRQHNPDASSTGYAATFDKELMASGWAEQKIEGPWYWGAAYTQGEDQAAALVEDHGVVLWVMASGVDPDHLVSFARSASQRIRNGG